VICGAEGVCRPTIDWERTTARADASQVDEDRRTGARPRPVAGSKEWSRVQCLRIRSRNISILP